jgi:hypothetical protein
MKRLYLAWGLSAVLTVTATAQEPDPDVLPTAGTGHKPRVVAPPDCPPVPRPFDPTRPPPSVVPIDPMRPPTEVPPEPITPAPRAPEAGGVAQGTFAPNMFGDRFGGSGSGLFGRPVSFSLLRNGSTTIFAPYEVLVAPRRFVPSEADPGAFPAQVLLDNRVITVGSPVFFAVDPVGATGGTGGTNELVENSQLTSVLRQRFRGASVRFLSGTATERFTGSNGFIQHEIEQTYVLGEGGIALPLPSSGGTVGRTRLTDDQNPLPRDRLILNYDYFANATLAPGGFDVHRAAAGIEMTFLDQWASVEARLPFASTLDSAIGSGGLTSRATELGNLFTCVKALLIRSDTINVSTGVAVSWPTAEDTRLIGPEGQELIVIENQSYIVEPFLAFLFTPDDRFFAQAWVHGGFDATGSPVFTNFDGRGLIEAGRLRDQRLLTTDLQVGYWIVRNPSGKGLRGLAPFIELHYTTTLNDAELVDTASGFQIGSDNRRYDEINMTTGFSALLGSNLLLTAGLVVPLGGDGDRFFDYQLGFRANWFFGPTAQDMCAVPGADIPGFPVPRTGEPALVPGAEPGVLPPAMPGAAPPGGAPPRAAEAGGLAQGTFAPSFFGDQIGISANRRVTGQTGSGLVRIPVLPRYAGLKPTDNDSARPMDRVYFSYNHYADVNGSVNPPGSPSIYLNREIIGLETTFGDDASLGVRLPFLQSGGDPEFSAREVGDVSVIGKYAIVNDPGTGNVVCLGMTITLPTGGRGDSLGLLDDGTVAPRAVFVQPWVGAAWNDGDLFVQGMSSVLLPTNPIYPAVWWNSVGAGYWLYCNRHDPLVQGVAPVIELHVNTPLTNREDDQVIFFRDQVNLTTGLYVQFPRLTVGGAVCIPLAGPRPYDYEAMFSVNYQF